MAGTPEKMLEYLLETAMDPKKEHQTAGKVRPNLPRPELLVSKFRVKSLDLRVVGPIFAN